MLYLNLLHLQIINTFYCFFFSLENGEFETVEIAPLSSPPELPDVMKGQEATHDTSTN